MGGTHEAGFVNEINLHWLLVPDSFLTSCFPHQPIPRDLRNDRAKSLNRDRIDENDAEDDEDGIYDALNNLCFEEWLNGYMLFVNSGTICIIQVTFF